MALVAGMFYALYLLTTQRVRAAADTRGFMTVSVPANIAGLALGRESAGGQAVAFYHVDSPLDAAQLEQVRALQDVTGAQMVRL